MNTDHPQIPESLVRSVLLEIHATALKRWRYKGTGPDYVEISRGRVRYDLSVLLEFIRKNTRVPSVRPQWRKLVELFKKKDSKFYWYDFKVRTRRCRGSTKETNRKRAEKIAALSDSVEDW